jgi:hypothetical protein
MVKLGDKVIDSVTGFTGIATSRHIYLTGIDIISVTARCVDNQPAVSLDFDEDRLIATVQSLQFMKEGMPDLSQKGNN